jgi:hypothetical protein
MDSNNFNYERIMQKLKRPTPLWLTIVIVSILAVTASLFLAPLVPGEIMKLSKFKERLYSSWINTGTNWFFIQDNAIVVNGSYHKFEPPQNAVGWGEQSTSPPIVFANVTLIEGIYYLNFSIRLDGPYLTGAYEIKCRFQTNEMETSQVFNLTITEYDKLPKVSNFDWRTEVSESNSYSYKIMLHKGWSRSAVSFNALLFYLATFYPEVAVAIFVLVGTLIGSVIYLFAKRRRSLRRSELI